MKKFTKTLVLLLAALMLFASCTPEANPTPKPEKVDTFPWKKVEIDPEHPYDALHFGLHHDQVKTVTESPLNGEIVPCDVTVKYSIFIPREGHPKTPVVLVLTPNNTTAKKFAESEIGQAWIKEANEKIFAVAFIEPLNGKTWNNTLSTEVDPKTKKAPRDERIAVYQVVQAVREKKVYADRAYLSADKNSYGLVGYGEGATAATIAAAAFPQVYSNTIAVRPVDFPKDKVNELLALKTFRHNDEYKGNAAKNPLIAKQIAMPMYVVADKADKASADNILAIWKDVNANALKEDSSAEAKYYTSQAVTDDSVKNLASLAIMNVRPRGYAGGTLRTRTDMWNDRGYEVFEGRLNAATGDQRVRRWATYTPEKLDESKGLPLVVCMHGSTASITDIVDESKWSTVADKNGFIVLYLQGYPGSAATHAPSWTFGQDDIDFIVAAVKDTASKHNIDLSRVYLTGHSLGAMMTQTLMNNKEAAEVFAAFAPIGAFSAPRAEAGTDWYGRPTFPTPDTPMPVYGLLGEWEFRSGNNTALKWAERFGVKEMAEPAFLPGYTEGKYNTWTFNNKDNVPVVKMTQVMDSPHVYMAEESEIVWDWCKDFSRDLKTKESLYKGTVIAKPAPEPAPEAK